MSRRCVPHHATLAPRCLVATGTLVGALLCIGTALAEPPRTPALACNGGGLSAPPRFGRAPPGRAEYSFSGICTLRDSGRMLGYRVSATWTPGESDVANANASEVFQISTLAGPGASYTVVLGARCDRDPWLHHTRCNRVGDNVPAELLELWPGFTDQPFPFNRNGIGQAQRQQLQAEYARANGQSPRQRHLQQGVRAGDGPERAAALQHRVEPTRSGDAVLLNPQPLPPKISRQAETQQTGASRKGTQAGIIIVSGRTPVEEEDVPRDAAAPAPAVSP